MGPSRKSFADIIGSTPPRDESDKLKEKMERTKQKRKDAYKDGKTDDKDGRKDAWKDGTDGRKDAWRDGWKAKRTLGRTVGNTDESKDGRTDESKDGRTDESKDGRTDESKDGRTDESKDDRTDESKDAYKDDKTDAYKDDKESPGDHQHPVINEHYDYLTFKQKQVLNYLLKECKDGICSVKKISETLDYPYESVRKHIRKLHQEKIITKPQIYRHRNFKGLKFKFTKGFQTAKNPKSLIEEEEFFYNNSSSSLPKDAYPSLKFLFDLGLDEKKISRWCRQFAMDKQYLILQLEYAVFDLRDNDALQKRDIRAPLAYIEKTLENEDGYPKPGNYKSRQEKHQEALETKKKALEKLEKQRQEERGLAEKEIFMAFLSDPKAVQDAIDTIPPKTVTPGLNRSIRAFKDKGLIDKRLENRLRLIAKGAE